MPVYHFDLIDDDEIEDTSPFECDNLEEAMEIARGVAWELVQEQPGRIGLNCQIKIWSEGDKELGRVLLDEIVRSSFN